MRTASARALWPFFVLFSAPSPAWIARPGSAPEPHMSAKIICLFKTF